MAIGKTKIALWRPEFASHTNDLERVAFVPILGTEEKLYAAIRLAKFMYTSPTTHETPTFLTGVTMGRCYKASIINRTSGSWSKNGNRFIDPYNRDAGSYILYKGVFNYNDDTDDYIAITLPTEFSSNADIKVIAWSNDDEGIVQIHIDDATTLVNGNDVDGSGKLDFYFNDTSFHTGEYQVAKNLDISGVTPKVLKIINTNTKNAAADTNRWCIFAVIVIDKDTEVEPDSECWMDNMFQHYTPTIFNNAEQLNAYGVVVSSVSEWMGGIHFKTRGEDCYPKDPADVGDPRDGESDWEIAIDGTTWTPAAGDRTDASFVKILQEFTIQHPFGPNDTIDNAAAVDKGGGEVGIPCTGHSYTTRHDVTFSGTTNYDNTYRVQSATADEIVIEETYNAETFAGTESITSDTDVCRWRCDIIIAPGKMTMTKNFEWLVTCEIASNSCYDLMMSIGNQSLTNNLSPLYAKVPNNSRITIDTSGTTPHLGANEISLYGGPGMFGCEIVAYCTAPMENVYVLDRTDDHKIYFRRNEGAAITITNGDEWLSSTMLEFKKHKPRLGGEVQSLIGSPTGAF